MLFAEPGDYSVTTVLGSCVSVCLWDPASRTGGINHYLLPLWNGDGLRTPKYGNIAIPMLVEKLLQAGCARGNLKAKVFGGASVLEGSSGLLNVGEGNIHFAEGAAEKIAQEKPDVMTLDIEMPRMDGLTFLQKIMEQHPIPVVIISSLAGSGTETAMKALESGAVDIIEKPQLGTKEYIEEASVFICDAVKAASQAKPSHVRPPLPITNKLSADAVIQKSGAKAMLKTTEKVIVVGASTGGTEAIAEFLTSMPMDAPGIVIVQHMPERFTAAFAKRLDSICAISVIEAEGKEP